MTQPLSIMAPGTVLATPAASVALLVPMGRLSLRARGDLAPLSAALGPKLPQKIGRRVKRAGVEALCLGPEEWMLHCAPEAVDGLLSVCATVYADHPHSLVDVSGREVSLGIDGARALDLLAMGCPRDLDALPVGEGRRTLFDGTSVILWRDKETAFRMDVWTSFAPHLLHLLETGARELSAGY